MKALFALAVMAIIFAAGCTGQPQTAPPNQSGSGNHTNGTVGLPNPASKFCADSGYRLELRTYSVPMYPPALNETPRSGGVTGYCLFPNGRECEEWAFFRGDCTDADSFEMVESPGYVANPKSISYKFHSDGRLVLSTRDLREGNANSLTAWLKPKDFASFVKTLDESGFGALNSSYRTCGGDGGPCPTDMPSITLTLLRQGKPESVDIYAPAGRPKSVDSIILDFKALFEANTFVEVNVSGCKLMKEGRANGLDCFGCPRGITNPKCTQAPNPTWYAVTEEGFGSCTVDANGSCAYLPPEYLTQKLCEASGGNWNECGSACRGAPEGSICTMQCVTYCECGGIAGFGCPTGYFCTDFLPEGAADAMGICKRAQ